MRMIADAGCGAVVYLHNTSRGFEIDNSADPARLLLHGDLRAIEAHEDRHKRILRAVGLGGQILFDLGLRRIRLLSNTPMHIPALEGFGLEIVEQVPIPVTMPEPACPQSA
jgi:3,4-dihydroxy 2-butanone 4-phosphate synthase/GTP cyclohydrolase II